MNPDIVTEEAGVMADIQGLLITGGPVVWILCVFSLIALTIVLVKVWQLVALRAESSKVVSGALEQWRAGKGRDAVDQLDDAHPVAAVVKCAMVGRMDKVNDLLLREEVERIASARLNDLRSFFRPLELIGALSPLLGLLGTVMGMIVRSEEHTSELQSRPHLVCRLLLEKKKHNKFILCKYPHSPPFDPLVPRAFNIQ